MPGDPADVPSSTAPAGMRASEHALLSSAVQSATYSRNRYARDV